MPEEADAAEELLAHAKTFYGKVTALRAEVEMPEADASPSAINEALVSARAHLESIEPLYGLIIGLKNSTATRAKHLENEAEDAWEDQADAERRRYGGGRREYEGAKERYAYWNLAIRAQRHRARRARELADQCADIEERARLIYRGLDAARHDLNRRLSYLQWDLSMER